jgi:hypothetical protein
MVNEKGLEEGVEGEFVMDEIKNVGKSEAGKIMVRGKHPRKK